MKQPLTLFRFLLLLSCGIILASCASTGEEVIEQTGPTAEEQLAELQSEYETLAESFSDLEALVSELAEIMESSTEPGELSSAAEQLVQNRNALEAELTAAQSQLASAGTRLTALQTERDRLKASLSQAEFAGMLFGYANTTSTSAESGTGTTGTTSNTESASTGTSMSNATTTDSTSTTAANSTETSDSSGATASGNNPAQGSSVTDASMWGRSTAQPVAGSKLQSQSDSAGNIYITHRREGISSTESVYLEIRQSSAGELALFLVASDISPRTQPAFGLEAVEISLAGSFLIELDSPTHSESGSDDGRRLERAYFTVDRNLLQALGRMATAGRGTIEIRGLYSTTQVIMDRNRAGRFVEMISAFLEMGGAGQ